MASIASPASSPCPSTTSDRMTRRPHPVLLAPSVARTGCTTICPGCCSCRVGPALVPAVDRRQRLDQAGPAGVSGAAARSARHRPLQPHQRRGAGPAHCPTAGEVPQPVSRRQHSARRRVHSRSAEPGRPWSLLGQSFGGFAASPTSPCSRTVCTRSTSPAGGPIYRRADEVYRATYQRVADKNRAFFARFPTPRPSPTGWPTTCTAMRYACPTASA